MDKILEVLNWFAEQVIYRYKDKLESVRASGLLIDSMTSEVTRQGTNYEVTLNLQEYWYYIENGRLPGTWPNIDAIREWIEVKPIIPQPFQLPNGNTVIPTEQQLTYLISRSIYENGIEAKPFLAESIEEVSGEFIRRLTQAFGEYVATSIREEFSDFPNIIN